MWYYWPALMRRYIQLYKGQLARKLSISRNILGDKRRMPGRISGRYLGRRRQGIEE